ncbi:phosphoribosylanthranilate isomerase [soil metagenome]
MKVKVCGITDIEQLMSLAKLPVDYAGLIFYNRSPRYMAEKITSNLIQQKIFPFKKVGVFVNAEEEFIKAQIKLYALDAVQLHGDETPVFCEKLRKYATVIKAFKISNFNQSGIDELVEPFKNTCDYYLLDTFSRISAGGTGEKFNWDALANNKISKPFFLSGGISADDAEAIKTINHPFLHAIDINSGFETEPGKKDINRIENFLQKIK